MRTVLEATGQKNYEQLAQGFKLTCRSGSASQKADRHLQGRRAGPALRRHRAGRLGRDGRDRGGRTAPPAAGRWRCCAKSARCRRRPASWPGCSSRICRISTSVASGRRSSASRTSRPGAHLVAGAGAGDRAHRRDGEQRRGRRRSRSSTPTTASGWRRTCSAASCGGDCRGKLVNVMLSGVPAGAGRLRRAVSAPAARSRAPRRRSTFAHLHARFLWCQVDSGRPRRSFAIACWCRRSTRWRPTRRSRTPKTETAAIEDLVDLIALVPEPPATDAAATATWKKLIADARARRRPPGARPTTRARAASARERANPPPMIRKVNFCGAAAAARRERRDEAVSQATAPARSARCST